jgi:hypothetical protein
MVGTRSPIELFRKRLNELLHERFDGKYTVLAKRAGIPISSMQHYMHTAKHMPGGEHVQRLAEACGVTADYLLSGGETVRPSDMFTKPVQVVRAGGQAGPELERQISVPLFRCSCPKECVFEEAVPPVAKARARVVIPMDMIAGRNYHRLIGVLMEGNLRRVGFGEGGRAVIDWDSRAPDWDHVVLYFDGTKHLFGRVKSTDSGLLASDWQGQASPNVLPKTAKVLGRVVAVLATP